MGSVCLGMDLGGLWMVVLSASVLVTNNCVTNGPTLKTTSTFYLSFRDQEFNFSPPAVPSLRSPWLRLWEGFTERGVCASYRFVL